MSIDLSVPYSVDEIKKVFDGGDETLGLLMTSNCLNYLKAVCAFSKELIKDGRIDGNLESELISIKVHSAYLIAGLLALCKEYNHEYDFE